MQTQIEDSTSTQRLAYSLAEVASKMGVHRATVHRLVQAGKLRAISGFGRLKVSDIELSRFLGATRDYQASTTRCANAARQHQRKEVA